MTEMQRLVADRYHNKSVSSWRGLLPDVFNQIELEGTHNKRLRQAIGETKLSDMDTGTFL